MKLIFVHLYNFYESRKAALWLTLLALLAFFAVLSLRVSFEEDISKILNMDAKTKNYNTIIQSSKVVDKLIFTVSNEDSTVTDPDHLISFTDSLGAKLTDDPGKLIKKLSIRVEDENIRSFYTLFLQNLPLFLENSDYKDMDSLFTEEHLKASLQKSLQTLSTPLGVILKYNLMYDPAGIGNNYLKRLRNFQTTSNLNPYNGYLFSRDNKHLVFYLELTNPSSETGKNGGLLDQIDRKIAQLQQQKEFKNIQCQYFGSAAISVGNARQLQHDSILTIIISGIALFLLLFLVFRKRRIPLLILLTVTFGGGFALAMVAVFKGSISLIAIGAGSVILGIAVNYPIHLLSHKLYEKDIRNVIRDMVVPLTIGSATTIGGFLCLLLMKTELLRDLGIFGALSLVGAALFTLIFLPHMMGKQSTEKKSVVRNWLERLGETPFEKKKIPLLLIFLITPVLIYYATKVGFDSDLTKLNYMPEKLHQAENLLNKINGGAKKSIYAVSYGKSREEAIDNSYAVKEFADSLNNAGQQCLYSSVTSVIPPIRIQKERLEKWNEYWTDQRREAALKNLGKAGADLGFTPDAFGHFSELVQGSAQILPESDYNMLIDAFAKDLLSHKDSLYTLLSVVKVAPDKQEATSQKLSEVKGTTLMEWKSMANHLLTIINNDFNLLFVLSASLVFLALLLTYGRIELTLVTFIPMIVSWVWILGLMEIMGLKFNFVNIILSTFIFGLGDDFCIFVMDGLQQQNKTGKKHFTSIRMGIYLSSLTTIIGFGVLIFAKHPALRSLAFVSIVGIATVLFISQTLEPFLFNLFITKQQQKGRPPITFSTILKSAFAFSYFVLGCIFLSAVGPILWTFYFISRRKSFAVFHWLMHLFLVSLIKVMANVKKNFYNPSREDFTKPAIIISNHQSVLDILLIISLHPKIVLITNKWVWNSPVFGFIVRLAGYHPVIDGIEPSIEKLSKAAANGYSIAIFPEGTRSLDGTIGRFHKGAFYLAGELGLDILPVLIHGANRCIPKGSFTVYDETISYKILPRIASTDTSFGNTYQERTKRVARLFKNEYQEFANEIETPDFYRNQLCSGYIYKGPVLEWYLKVKIRLENNYKLFHELVPKSGTIVDAGCGYGFLSNMLAFLAKERQILGIDYDEEKIEVASHVWYKLPNVTFEANDLTKVTLPASDCIIISDVLHYMNEADRNRFLLHCIESVNPGGAIIIRDADKSKVKRHKGSVLTEVFSTKIFSFNKTKNALAFFSGEDITNLAINNGMQVKTIDNTKFTSNILIVLTKNL